MRAAVLLVIALALLPSAVAQEAADTNRWAPYERVDAPVEVDPAVCPLWVSGVALGLGSEQIAVAGFDEEGACIVEVVGETEGAWFHDVCRIPPDAGPFEWSPPRTWAEGHGFPGPCTRVGDGNFLMPGGDDGPDFPATLPYGAPAPER